MIVMEFKWNCSSRMTRSSIDGDDVDKTIWCGWLHSPFNLQSLSLGSMLQEMDRKVIDDVASTACLCHLSSTSEFLKQFRGISRSDTVMLATTQ